MNTVQMYTGKGNNAYSSTQAAKNRFSEGQTLPPPVNPDPQRAARLDSRLAESRAELINLVDHFFVEAEASFWLDMLLDYYTFWTAKTLDPDEGDFDPNAQYPISGFALDRVRFLMRLMCFITALSDANTKIEWLLQKQAAGEGEQGE